MDDWSFRFPFPFSASPPDIIWESLSDLLGWGKRASDLPAGFSSCCSVLWRAGLNRSCCSLGWDGTGSFLALGSLFWLPFLVPASWSGCSPHWWGDRDSMFSCFLAPPLLGPAELGDFRYSTRTDWGEPERWRASKAIFPATWLLNAVCSLSPKPVWKWHWADCQSSQREIVLTLAIHWNQLESFFQILMPESYPEILL